MIVVYPYRKSNSYDNELRYSLRSLSNIKVDKVFIVGECPDWVTNVTHIKSPQAESKTSNVYRALKKACYAVPEDEFLLMNDDFYIMEPMDEIKLYHGGALDEFLKKYNSSFPDSYYTKLISVMNEKLGGEANHYELHVPMMINKYHALTILEDDRHRGSMFRTVYGNKFYEGRGERIEDVKIYRRTTDDIQCGESGFLSSDDSAFSGKMQSLLSRKFPDRCIYEMY